MANDKVSLKDRLLAKTSGLAEAVAKNPGKPVDERPLSTMPGQLGAFRIEAQRYQETIDTLTKQLEAQQETDGSLEILLSDLHEVKGRRRKLTDEQFRELKENLRNNPMVAPISVRRRAIGGFEIVSGHNRTDIFRELGRDRIKAVILDSDDDTADLSAFYANLLQPDLPDFEKYLGFKMLRGKRPDLSHEQIAEMSGKSRPYITQLMAFEELPKDVLKLLENHANAVGANAAQAFATLAKQGKVENVTRAISKIISGELDQKQAIKFATTDQSPKVNAAKPDPIRIKAGKATYCDMRRLDRVIRLEFKSAEEAAEIESAVHEVLQNRAREIKNEPK